MPKIAVYDTTEERLTPSEVAEFPMAHHLRGLSWTVSGYGSRIPTSRMAKIDGQWHRIYCRVFSNAGTCYVIKGGRERLLSHDSL